MTTPTRRQFIGTFAGLVAAPYMVARTLVAAQSPLPPETPNVLLTSSPLPLEERVRVAQGRAIKVPSNRYLTYVQRQPDGGFADRVPIYVGEWDGTFKLEPGCTNPVYILADLVTHGAPDSDQHALVDWKATYRYGVWCDQLVPNDSEDVSPTLWVPRVRLTNPDIERDEATERMLLKIQQAWQEPTKGYTVDLSVSDLRHHLLNAGFCDS